MKNFTILIFSLFISVGAFSQDELFTNLSQFGIGSTEIDIAQSGIYDSDGHMLVYGSFRGEMDCDPSENSGVLSPLGSPDLFVAKYDASGGLLWSFNLGRISLNNGMDASGLTVDSDNNIIIAGSFSNTVDFNPMGAPAAKASNGGKDAFLAKYSAEGELLWVNTFGSILFENGAAVQVDNSDNIYLGLRYSGSIDVDPSGDNVILEPQTGGADAALIKYSSDGDYSWHFEVSTPDNDNITALAVAQNGKVAVGANVNGAVSGIPQSDMQLSILNGDGSIAWEYNFANFNNSNSISSLLFTDGGESLYIAGRIQGDTDFDPNSENQMIIQPLFADAFFAKYDIGNASLIWARYIESAGIEDYVAGITEAGSALMALGSFDNVATFNPGDFTSQIASQGEMDIYMIALDKSTGEFIDARTFGSAGNEFARHAFFNPDGNVIATGSYTGSLAFTPEVTPIPSIGFSDIFFAEFSFQINLSSGTLSPPATEDIIIYPNPTSGMIDIDISGYSGYPVQVKIISIVGEVVKELAVDNAAKLSKVDLSSLNNGVYILEIDMEAHRFTKRIIKN